MGRHIHHSHCGSTRVPAPLRMLFVLWPKAEKPAGPLLKGNEQGHV